MLYNSQEAILCSLIGSTTEIVYQQKKSDKSIRSINSAGKISYPFEKMKLNIYLTPLKDIQDTLRTLI